MDFNNFLKMEEGKALQFVSIALRLGVGLVLLKAGLDHVGAPDDSMFGMLVAAISGGLMPTAVAGGIELLLGLVLILGLFTRIVAGITAVFFLVTLVLTWPHFVAMATAGGVPGPLAEMFMLKDIMGLGASVALFFLGFRGLGIDQFLLKK